jgi:hypothetical protein
MKKYSKSSSANTRELTRKVAAAQRQEKSARHRADAAKSALKRMRKAFKLAKKAAKESRRTLKALSKELHHHAKAAPKPTVKKKKAPRPAVKKSPMKKSAPLRPKLAKMIRARKPAPASAASLPASVPPAPEVIRAEDPGLTQPPLSFSPPSDPPAS